MDGKKRERMLSLVTFQSWESLVGARYKLNRSQSYARDHYFRHCTKSRGKMKKDENYNILNAIVKVSGACAFIGVYAVLVYQ
jgi:hypothetical protein